MAKLSKEQLMKKKEAHEKRVLFYSKKIEEIEHKEKKIGFKW